MERYQYQHIEVKKVEEIHLQDRAVVEHKKRLRDGYRGKLIIHYPGNGTFKLEKAEFI